MTEENYKYRTSPLFLRNQFKGKGKLQIPIIPKFQIQPDDFNGLLFIGFDKIGTNDTKHVNRMVHFFLYDYKFERVWKNPDTDLEKLKCYRAVLSPDFSMYVEMAPVLQLYNTFRNRWCGAYFASKGIRVVPTISWGHENTFEFCFDGIEKGSVVAVSTYMVSEHDNRQDQKEFFLKGYNEMLRRIEPEKIICYNTPFPEMQGDIVFVDYELSSWRYMGDAPYTPSIYAKYICGEAPLPAGSNLIIKSGYVVNENSRNYNSIVQAGMGSAYGAKWKPHNEFEARLWGKPGEIKVSYKKDGTKFETKIGDNGKASLERHHTTAPNSKYHSNPHDHKVNWDSPDEHPDFEPAINYFDGNVPEFKSKRGGIFDIMKIADNKLEDDCFKTISDFKECMRFHGEVVLEWHSEQYGIFWDGNRYCIAKTDGSYEKWCDTADEVLEYKVGKDRLRDVITQVIVIDRTI
ncbi:DUF4417 domain-containing protein [Caproicibacter fermentans]|uniref:DUF4417 domain-containing protein n=1 Tax=Caproicibacter fermentans TaxID=2576756 RepID=A0A7G8TDK2_9FIRM|nr:DUF4417 domain-containing protein [Caproicibacter fermentans]QNK41693.1 DUF4417 domain-containing protein [Caproicibacter fermentans]